jgi:hypothetical protein
MQIVTVERKMCCLRVQSSDILLSSSEQPSAVTLGCRCRIGEAGTARKVDICVICLYFSVPWHSDLNFPCSNLTVGKKVYLKNRALEAFLFRKEHWLLTQNIA